MAVTTGYKKTEFGLIPKDWELSDIKSAYDVHNNLRLPISQKIRETMVGDYPYYGATGIQGYINEYRVEGEYSLIGEDGDHFLKWKNQTMTLLVNGKFNVNNHAHLIKGSKNLTTWFYYFFAHRDLTPYLTRQGAGRYKLTKQALLQLPCVVPPLNEQRAIATAVSDMDQLIAALDQLIAKKCDIKQATMQQLLTGKQRLAGFSGKWESKKLGELLKVRHGKSQHEVVSINGRYPILATGGEIGRTDQFLYDKPSVLIGRKGTIDNPQYIETPFWTIDTLFFTEIVSSAHPKFIYYKFTAINWRGYNEASGVPSLNSSTIENIIISCPEKNEQSAIAAVLSDIDADILALEQRQNKTKLIKQGMMQELLTGKTRLV